MPPSTTRAAPDRTAWSQPWAQLKFVTFQPHIFPRMLGGVSPDAKAGDLVAVYDKLGQRLGAGQKSARTEAK